MRERWRPIAALGVLLALVLLLTWRGGGEPDKRTAREAVGPTLTAYARDVALFATDAAGNPAWQLLAPQAAEYGTVGLWQLQAPRWRLYPDTGAPWQGTAERGRAWADGGRIELRGDVTMRRATAGGMTRLQTTFLQLQTAERYAHTPAPVTLIGPDYRIDARGAEAWLDAQRIELLNEVRGRHALDDP